MTILGQAHTQALIDYLNNKIIDKKDVEKGTTAPVIGFISHNRLRTEMPVIEKPGSTLAESLRSVRTNLKYFIKEIKCPVISVSSTIIAEGKTFVSANLAAIISMSDKKVLLVTHSEQFLVSILTLMADEILSPDDIRCYLTTKERKMTTFKEQEKRESDGEDSHHEPYMKKLGSLNILRGLKNHCLVEPYPLE
jgi:hypothetical protein